VMVFFVQLKTTNDNIATQIRAFFIISFYLLS
jgi:hypothetical protein